MRRSNVSLEEITDFDNLVSAFHLAAGGKGNRATVREFREDLYGNLARMGEEILGGSYRPGRMTRFFIHDPKKREIHAPAFRDRVCHHALMAVIGPVLDRSLVYDTYACRVGKGTLAAVKRCRYHSRKFPWFVKGDIRSYFSSIDHEILKNLLRRRLKNRGTLGLIDTFIDSYCSAPGKGIPIGALTSQYFANFYLSPLDRWLLEKKKVVGMVRYMDDVVWWCHGREEGKALLEESRGYLAERLALDLKENSQINRSAQGVTFCGFRIFSRHTGLTKRGKRNYSSGRKKWERRYEKGLISPRTLQEGYGALLGTTLHADARGWRRGELEKNPPSALLEAV